MLFVNGEFRGLIVGFEVEERFGGDAREVPVIRHLPWRLGRPEHFFFFGPCGGPHGYQLVCPD